MKKIILILAFVSSFTFAATEEQSLCPPVERIKFELIKEPNIYRYKATNTEGKQFISDIYGGSEGNGPAPALWLEKATYDASTKKLICIYYAYSIYGKPVLINEGDY